jgi:hypothetical protein
VKILSPSCDGLFYLRKGKNMLKKEPFYNKEEVKKEIESIFTKHKVKQNLTNLEYLTNCLTYFYEFKRKDTRMKIIRDIYEHLRIVSIDYKFREGNHKFNPEIETLFKKIANQIYQTSPDKHSIEYMIREYLKIIDSENHELTKRILHEIYDLLFQVNKMTQLYYNGDGKGRVIYLHRLH